MRVVVSPSSLNLCSRKKLFCLFVHFLKLFFSAFADYNGKRSLASAAFWVSLIGVLVPICQLLEHVAASGEVEPLHRETASVDAGGRVAPAVLDECIQFVGGHHGGSKRSCHQTGQRQPAAELEHTLAGEQVTPGK